MKENLKLYVWENVLRDYSCGAMFALAESVEEAREMLLKRTKYLPKVDLAKEPDVYEGKFALDVWGGC